MLQSATRGPVRLIHGEFLHFHHENGQVEDFPILKGALLDSIKKSAARLLSGKAPRMKNQILST